MNVIWIMTDTLRRDHIGAYGNKSIHTPSLDLLASRSVRFDRHYAAGFPTMPSRADLFTGRWTISFMKWEPLAGEVETLAQLLSRQGFRTAACVDTPFYLRYGMNYDRGFQTFFTVQGQEGSATRYQQERGHESRDIRAWWRLEADRNAPQTITKAMDWLERHYKEDFFLYIDTWDPHEPWDAPPYYTERYWPGYDGEIISPIYGHRKSVPGFTEERVRKAHATYCGEVTMVDTWVGYLLRKVENMGLAGNTAIIFTSDHGFYFGEHGDLFGKMTFANKPDGTIYNWTDLNASWTYSPLYEELVTAPLLVQMPGIEAGSYDGLTSAIDLAPTVLEILGQETPAWMEGRSLLTGMRDRSAPGREYVVSTIPFANKGDEVMSVDNVSRTLRTELMTTVTAGDWSLLYSMEPGVSELYDLVADPLQGTNLVSKRPEVAKDIHGMFARFMAETNLPPRFQTPRRELRL